jgi:hypothetical protein
VHIWDSVHELLLIANLSPLNPIHILTPCCFNFNVNIFTCYCLDSGLVMSIECSGHLIFVTTNNCNTFTIPYLPEITTALNICYNLTSLFAVIACGNDDSAWCFSPLRAANHWLLWIQLVELLYNIYYSCKIYKDELGFEELKNNNKNSEIL